MNAATAELRCPVCGAMFSERVPYPGKTSPQLRFAEIALCEVCGIGTALPRRTQGELDAFYASGTYWQEIVGNSRVQTLHERNQSRHRVRLALDHLGAVRGLRVLDVGAGHGWIRHWLEKLATAVQAFDFIEPDDARSREIIARGGRVPATRVASLDAAEARYDLIFLNHVLEHVADPVDAVTRVRALLKPEGVAYFEMPHADQRFKADVFPHTWFFTHDALARLARSCGMTEVLRESFGRFPSSDPTDLFWRAGFRAAAALDMKAVSGFFDGRIWHYRRRDDGIWLRWMVRRVNAQATSVT